MLTDKEKLSAWNKICVEQNWASEDELEKWLFINQVSFTNAGSCLANGLRAMSCKSVEEAEDLISGGGEIMATHILRSLTGLLTFIGTGIEVAFWAKAIAQLMLEVDIYIPPEIMPKLVRDTLKYNGDGTKSFDSDI